MSNEKDESVFKDSLKEALVSKIEEDLKEYEVLDKKDVLPMIKERLEEGETQWDLLRRMVEGGLTEKFIRIISDMPDRDYVRNYLKLLEHFKPKLTRADAGEGEKPDLTINIQTMIVNSEGEKQIVPINEIEIENEK